LYFRYNFLFSPTAVMIQILILSFFLVLFKKKRLMNSFSIYL
jgi:hypothetical protein